MNRFSTNCLAAVCVLAVSVGCLHRSAGTSQTSDVKGRRNLQPATSAVKVQILALNDFHGHLEPPAGNNANIRLPDGTGVLAGGITHLAARIAQLRQLNPNTLVVSAGDLIGASPLVSAAFHDEPTINAMNAMGLALNGVGNHEFDHGEQELLRMQHGGCHPTTGCIPEEKFAGAGFKFLAANVRTQKGAGPSLFPAYDVQVFDGVRVAFIGMTLHGTPEIVSPWGIADLRFDDEVETANRLVEEIQAKGIHAIVVLLHEGGYSTGTYDSCDGISGAVVQIAERMSSAVDVILSGHTHQAYNCTLGGKLVTSAASFGRVVTQVNLVLDPVTGRVTHKEAHNLVVTRDLHDIAMDTLVQHYSELTRAKGSRVVGSVASTLLRAPSKTHGLSAMGAVIADAQLEATHAPAHGGADIAFTNTGGVRADLVRSASGEVHYSDLFTVQPFGDSLVVMTLTGEQLRAVLEQQVRLDAAGGTTVGILQSSSGFSYAIKPSQPAGSRVSSMKLRGVAMDDSKRYRVTVNSFLAAGGDGFTGFQKGADTLVVMTEMEALVAYFEAHSPVSPPVLERILIQ